MARARQAQDREAHLQRTLRSPPRWDLGGWGGGESALRWGQPAQSGMGAHRAKLKRAPGSRTGKNNRSDICSVVS